MTCGREAPLTRFWIGRWTPSVAAVLAQEASSIVAEGAAALAHSTSRVASPSSLLLMPGLPQALPPCGAGCTTVSLPRGYCVVSWKTLRKVVQSEFENRLV